MNAPVLPGRIEHWPLARLKPYARNAKTHDADQVAKIAASMAEFGWTVPVLVAADGELIAAETTGRVCFGIELNPAYVDVAIERWQQFTGVNAVLLDTGETFADLKTKRLAA